MRIKSSILLLAAAAFLCVVSCTKAGTDTDESYFSDAQKKALKVLNGSFAYTLSIGSYSNTTTSTFLEQYNPPKKATVEGGGEISVHGKYRVVYEGGETFEKYYDLSNSADRLYSYFSLTNINSIQKQDFQLVDDNTFKLKEIKATLWDTYKRK